MAQLDRLSVDLLVRLEALAAGLEAEGFLGQAKLYRAVLRSLLTRAAYESNVPRAGNTLIAAMRQAQADLGALGMSAPLGDAFDTATTAAAEGRATLWDEIGAVHVCRLCGELFLTDTPEYCPTCGTHEAGYWDVPPIYHLEPMTPRGVMHALETMPDTLRQILNGLTDADTRRNPAPGEWSVRETLSHLQMAQGVLAARTELLLTETYPALASQAVWTFKADDSTDIDGLMAEFETLRQQILTRLHSISYDEWLRAGWHTEFGEVTLLQQASYFAKHERFHLPQFHALITFLAT